MADIRIADILKTEYSDFLQFCLNADKQYRCELVTADYIAFRSQSGFSREDIAKLRAYIESFAEPDVDIPAKVLVTLGITDPVAFSSVNTASQVLPSKSLGNRVKSQPVQSVQSVQPVQSVGLAIDSEMPLSQFFSVDWETYCEMPLTESDFGVRAYNCLRRGYRQDDTMLPCETVGEVLRLSPLQILSYKNMGKLSYRCILSTLSGIIQSGVCRGEKEPPANNALKTQVLAMLHDAPFELSAFCNEEKAAFAAYESAYAVIGKEPALAASDGDESVLEIIQMLKDFCEAPLKLYNRKSIFDQDAWALSNDIKALPVEPFLFAYHESAGKDKPKFSFFLDSEATVFDFIYAIMSDNDDIGKDLDYAEPFLRWLKFDKALLCESIRVTLQKQHDNAKFIFEQRMLGKTLEVIGNEIGVTRERIRQIEKKVATRLLRAYHIQKKNHDILAMIYALRRGDAVLRYDEIAAQIGDAGAQIIWYLAKKDLLNCDAYHFSRQSSSIIFGDEMDPVALSSLLEGLPTIIEKSEMPRYVADILKKHNIPEELLRMQLRTVYKRDGMFYHKGRLTIVSACDYILQTRFPNGYKIADPSDQARFISYLAEMFDKKGVTARALDAKISQIGVLVDRGKYLHSSYVNVDKAVIDKVNTYIRESPRTVITYTELFDTFSSLFSGTQISDKYCLQGALKLAGCPFVMRKDYITKERSANIASEFEQFVEENGKVHKSVLLDEFNGLSEFNIGFFCKRLTTIVTLDGGYYMHSSQLNISEEDYQKQRTFLLSVCSDTPVSTRTLYNVYMERFTDFMIANDVETPGNLFGVLQYMFKQEFYFSRPYISLINDSDLTHHGVLLQHLAGIDSIEIDDLTDICDKNGILFLSTGALLNSLEPDFIRVGKTMLMRKELVGVDDDSVLDTAQQISEIVHACGGYCASKNIVDFSWFPELNIPWNTYLLESVSAMAGDLLTTLQLHTSTIYTPSDVYIGDNYRDEDIHSLILRLLFEESQLEPFASKEAVFNWLQAQGLCNTKLPSFIETEGHLVCDERGKVTVCTIMNGTEKPAAIY